MKRRKNCNDNISEVVKKYKKLIDDADGSEGLIRTLENLEDFLLTGKDNTNLKLSSDVEAKALMSMIYNIGDITSKSTEDIKKAADFIENRLIEEHNAIEEQNKMYEKNRESLKSSFKGLGKLKARILNKLSPNSLMSGLQLIRTYSTESGARDIVSEFISMIQEGEVQRIKINNEMLSDLASSLAKAVPEIAKKHKLEEQYGVENFVAEIEQALMDKEIKFNGETIPINEALQIHALSLRDDTREKIERDFSPESLRDLDVDLRKNHADFLRIRKAHTAFYKKWHPAINEMSQKNGGATVIFKENYSPDILQDKHLVHGGSGNPKSVGSIPFLRKVNMDEASDYKSGIVGAWKQYTFHSARFLAFQDAYTLGNNTIFHRDTLKALRDETYGGKNEDLAKEMQALYELLDVKYSESSDIISEVILWSRNASMGFNLASGLPQIISGAAFFSDLSASDAAKAMADASNPKNRKKINEELKDYHKERGLTQAIQSDIEERKSGGMKSLNKNRLTKKALAIPSYADKTVVNESSNARYWYLTRTLGMSKEDAISDLRFTVGNSQQTTYASHKSHLMSSDTSAHKIIRAYQTSLLGQWRHGINIMAKAIQSHELDIDGGTYQLKERKGFQRVVNKDSRELARYVSSVMILSFAVRGSKYLMGYDYGIDEDEALRDILTSAALGNMPLSQNIQLLADVQKSFQKIERLMEGKSKGASKDAEAILQSTLSMLSAAAPIFRNNYALFTVFIAASGSKNALKLFNKMSESKLIDN